MIVTVPVLLLLKLTQVALTSQLCYMLETEARRCYVERCRNSIYHPEQWVGGVLVSPLSGKVSKSDIGREGKLERIAELGESRLIHKLEECAIRCLTLILI